MRRWWRWRRRRRAVSAAKMWQWAVLGRLSALLLVAGTFDVNFFSQRRQYVPTSQMNCYDYPKFTTDKLASTMLNQGFRTQRSGMNQLSRKMLTSMYPLKRNGLHRMMPRSLRQSWPLKDDIYREHAKLVQDINSLKQVLYVAPLVDDHREFDESVFHEILEMSTTTSPLPVSTKTNRPTKSSIPTKSSSIPIVLLGGASNRNVVKSQPLTFSKPTINLVGTTISPILKHPYPFVMQGSSSRPFRVCMPTMTYATTTERPSLWQRLINSIIPR